MQPPSRRSFLALGLLLTAAACTTGPDREAPADARRPDPDEPLRRRAVTATDALLAAYDGLPTAQLQPLRAEVAEHRAALAQTLTPPTPPAPSTTTPGATAPTPTATPSPVTTTAELAALERRTAQAHLADLGAASPQLARLLASVAASAAVHATALGDTAPPAAPDSSPSAPSSPSATPGAALTPEAVTALQGALNAEHAAIYGYGVVGAKLPDDQQRADARTAYADHQARRDAWQRLLTGVGATPGAAAAGYQLPFAVTDAAAATRLAAHIETRLTVIYADLVAAVPAQQRTAAADALREAALHARRWGAPQRAFPGIDDQATASPTASPTPAPTPSATS
ncbi:ferritin-like domain-containing protein [Kitasatospora sp. NPDC057904]|uniref:ferritin-like domain-containing protein n=1 Tax=Kitasatospora sp. NPDC057904 TaxID=3346275 RepID=UPI0036D993CD